MTKKALLIGINYFGSNCELSGCHSDILDVKSYLESCGFPPENIVVMLDKSPKAHQNSPTACGLSFQMDDQHIPIKDNIIREMTNIAANSSAGDLIMIHYSGHGSNRKDTSGDEKDCIDECICPSDYETNGMIYDDDMRIILVDGMHPKSKLRVVFDACHSGSALDLPLIYTDNPFNHFHCENKCVLDRDVLFISGCKDPQTSADSSFEHPNGALTYFLIKSLIKIQTVTKLTKNQKCAYTYKDLMDMIRLGLKKSGYSQIPQLSMMEKSQLKTIVEIL
jgi:hypothetical protein